MEAWINSGLLALNSALAESGWLAPLFALLAGALTSLTPCSLSTIPLVVGYVGGTGAKDTRVAFRLSLLFALGMGLTITALGLVATLAGRIFTFTGSWVSLVLGGLMVLMALQIWGLINLIPSSYAQGLNKRKGSWGALAAGLLGGLFSSPCATPVLVTLLALVAKDGELVRGVFLLLLYSLSHGILVILAGTFTAGTKSLVKRPWFQKWSIVINIFLGILVFSFGLFYLYQGL